MQTTPILTISLTLGIVAAAMNWDSEIKQDMISEEVPVSSSRISNKDLEFAAFSSYGKVSGRRSRGASSVDETRLTVYPGASHEAEENLARLRVQASRRVDQLEQNLNLSSRQRDLSYSLIVRSSPLFTTDVEIGGQYRESLTFQEAQAALYHLLDEEQQDELVEDLIAEKEWWDELVVDLEKELDEEFEEVEFVSPVPAPEEAIQESEEQESFNLFDSLGQ